MSKPFFVVFNILEVITILTTGLLLAVSTVNPYGNGVVVGASLVVYIAGIIVYILGVKKRAQAILFASFLLTALPIYLLFHLQ